jgi:murein DD-endopeptidase MepM/ murein hydrolase activator NlpD
VADSLRRLGRILATIYLVAVHLVAGFFALRYFYPDFRIIKLQPVGTVEEPLPDTPAPTPLPVPSQFVEDLATPTPAALPNDLVLNAPADQLLIPVKGVKREQLFDTFSQSRSEGRTHDAIDIMAPLGTPVLAAADGEIIKFFDSHNGGITIYELSADRRFIFYYAHLQRRADGLKEHDVVKRGTVIGYVGDTGNAGVGNYHLHFAIAEAIDPKRFWSGPYINPFPMLKNAVEAP